MSTESTISIIFGVIACASTLALILVRVPFFSRIYKQRTTEHFQPWPYLTTQINCFSWIVYYTYTHYSEPRNVFHFRCFIWFGFILLPIETYYILIFWYFTTQKNQVILGCILIFEVFIIQFCIAASMSSFTEIVISVIPKLNVNLSLFLGSTSVVSGIFMYGSPLFDIINVYSTKSSKYMTSSLYVAMFLSALSWFICAFTSRNFDPYVAITYGIGTLLGLVQLGLLYNVPDDVTFARMVNVNCVEATLDVNDDTEEIMVFDTYCGACKFHVFELEEKIKINPSARYLLSKDERRNGWIVREALTATNRFEAHKELQFEWQCMGHKRTFKEIWKSCLSSGRVCPKA